MIQDKFIEEKLKEFDENWYHVDKTGFIFGKNGRLVVSEREGNQIIAIKSFIKQSIQQAKEEAKKEIIEELEEIKQFSIKVAKETNNIEKVAVALRSGIESLINNIK